MEARSPRVRRQRIRGIESPHGVPFPRLDVPCVVPAVLIVPAPLPVVPRAAPLLALFTPLSTLKNRFYISPRHIRKREKEEVRRFRGLED